MHTNFELTDYQNMIALSRYARWREEDGRREVWSETVDRYFDYMADKLTRKEMTYDKGHMKAIRDAVFEMSVMPSMRALMSAGPALERCNVAGYNCSYLPVNSIRAFDEALYILMNGTGVGFSVEKHETDKLPLVNEHFEQSRTTIVVDDSKAGWARALRELIACLYAGQIPRWDTSGVRERGARLKTFGGRASGPEPLEELFHFCIKTFRNAAGRKLTPLECHDIMCYIGQIVVVGGVRRSALISLSDLDNDLMREAKSGQWYNTHSYRQLANNSAVYQGRPDVGVFMKEWHSLYASLSGERGIFNRTASDKQVMNTNRREAGHLWGTNPCGEIILRPFEFCNLSEVVIRETDGWRSIKEKVQMATVLGTWQSCLTDFKYLRKIWANNCNEERLLGVSLTAIMDNPLTNGTAADSNLEHNLSELRAAAVEANAKEAKRLGIAQSAAVTTVKPSGTVSQLVGPVGSGIHPQHAHYFIRRVRGDNKDPITTFLNDNGVPTEPCNFQPDRVSVFSFPIKAPKYALTKNDISAIDHLEIWSKYRQNWCEHNPSVTISVNRDEWPSVGAWVWNNFDSVGGVSFLPNEDTTVYTQLPYETIDKTTYDDMMKNMPTKIDWSKLSSYETEDTTKGTQELACTAGVCEIVDMVEEEN